MQIILQRKTTGHISGHCLQKSLFSCISISIFYSSTEVTSNSRLLVLIFAICAIIKEVEPPDFQPPFQLYDPAALSVSLSNRLQSKWGWGPYLIYVSPLASSRLPHTPEYFIYVYGMSTWRKRPKVKGVNLCQLTSCISLEWSTAAVVPLKNKGEITLALSRKTQYKFGCSYLLPVWSQSNYLISL